jgi:hypothetical protein
MGNYLYLRFDFSDEFEAHYNELAQNVRNNNELYFPKAQDNQSQQVQIPGLDLCPDSTPLIQEQHHPVLKQGQELSLSCCVSG